MHRFFIEEKLTANSKIEPNKNLKHYLSRVVRIKSGEVIGVFDGESEFKAFFNGQQIEVLELIGSKNNEKQILNLYQPRLENKKLSLVIQKATEIGVDNIYLFSSSRVKVKDSDRDLNKIERFKKIAQESAEQCNRIDIPNIEYVEFSKIKADADNVIYIGSTLGGDKISKLALNNSIKYSQGIIIGPEGGFSEEEMKSLEDRGMTSISFGDNILRSETASIYGLAIIKELN